MTLREAATALGALATAERAKGLNYVIVVAPWKRSGRKGAGDPMQLLPGLSGRFVGENDAGAPLIDLSLDDVERWVQRHGGSGEETSRE